MIVRTQTSVCLGDKVRASQPCPLKSKTAACGAQIDKVIPGPADLPLTVNGVNGACLILKALNVITSQGQEIRTL